MRVLSIDGSTSGVAAINAALEGGRESGLELRAMIDAERRDRELRESWDSGLLPIGSIVTTTVYAIGGRSEVVTGEVVEHRRRSMVVQTECHGRIVVAPDRVQEADR